MQSVDSNGGRSGINTLLKLAHSTQLTPKDMLGQYHKFKYEAQQDARIKNQTAMRRRQEVQDVMHSYNENAKTHAKENATRVRAGFNPDPDYSAMQHGRAFTDAVAENVARQRG